MLAKSVEISKKMSDEKFAEFKVGENGVTQIVVDIDLVRVSFDEGGETKTKGYSGFSFIYEEIEDVDIW